MLFLKKGVIRKKNCIIGFLSFCSYSFPSLKTPHFSIAKPLL